jgi:pimeloyl-ACP methyl ester carboxylesterase
LKVVPLASGEGTPETVVVEAPEVRYAKSGDVNIAYSVVGSGPVDLVFAPGFISNVEYSWEDPGLARFYRALGSFSRLIVFDKRGTGLSDRMVGGEPLETRVDDVRAVMDAVGSERAAIVGYSEGGSMATLFAATTPERTTALILYGALIAGLWSPETPWAWRREKWDAWVDDVERRWGTPAYCEDQLRSDAPSKIGDAVFERWYATRLRLGASPGAAAAMIRTAREIDLARVIPTVRVPTLVLQRVGDRVVDVQGARYLAERIAGARYVELHGDDHLPWVGDADAIVAEIRAFLASVGDGFREDELTDRVLATVLFTDIVGSTAKAAELGDRRWRELLAAHHARVRRQLVRFRGRELDTAGDGFFASFDGPARAIRCACAISESVRELGLELRTGLHTGECEVVDGKVGGIAVHIGARVAAEADPGEVVVSSTVKDLVAGSGIEFRERGSAQLKGVPGEWRLFAVTRLVAPA